jgi:hypothetical protein
MFNISAQLESEEQGRHIGDKLAKISVLCGSIFDAGPFDVVCVNYIKKGSVVHIAPVYTRFEEWSYHFGCYINIINSAAKYEIISSVIYLYPLIVAFICYSI